MDDVSEEINQLESKVVNELKLVQLRREDLHSILTCQATNNNLSIPASTSVKLDMHCEYPEHKFENRTWINGLIDHCYEPWGDNLNADNLSKTLNQWLHTNEQTFYAVEFSFLVHSVVQVYMHPLRFQE